MTDPVVHDDLERRLAEADAAARRPESIEYLLEGISPMTDKRWDSLAIEDLTEDEANIFWQAIAG